MIGGGQGAFIGGVHRIAARLDGYYDLVCGAFSSNPENSIFTGAELGLENSRTYSSYQELFEKEKQLPEEEKLKRADYIIVNDDVTPIIPQVLKFHRQFGSGIQ